MISKTRVRSQAVMSPWERTCSSQRNPPLLIIPIQMELIFWVGWTNSQCHNPLFFSFLFRMQWVRILPLFTLLILSVQTSPVPVPYDSEPSTVTKIENDILSQSELAPRRRRADDTLLFQTSTVKEEGDTGKPETETKTAQSRIVSGLTRAQAHPLSSLLINLYTKSTPTRHRILIVPLYFIHVQPNRP